MRSKVSRVLAGWIFAVWATSGEAAEHDSYQLGPSDRIRVNVSEWSTSGGEPRTRINGEFTIAPSGHVSIPLIGEIRAAGLSPEELARLVSEQMKIRAGAVNAPVTSVEVAQYRPIYVLGFVDRPGEYAFRPGMAVVHALSVAGGLYRRSDLGTLRLGRDAITIRGNLQRLTATLDELRIRRARLKAELEARASIDMPSELAARRANADVARMIDAEEGLLKARQESFASELLALEEAKALAEREADALRRQLAKQDERLLLLSNEVNDVRALVAKGLTNATRQFTAETALVDSEARKSQIETELVRAAETIARAESDARSLKRKRAADLLTEIDASELRIKEVGSNIETAEGLLGEAQATARDYGALLSSGPDNPSFQIVRALGGELKELVASEGTPLSPGDVVKVSPASFSAGSPLIALEPDRRP